MRGVHRGPLVVTAQPWHADAACREYPAGTHFPKDLEGVNIARKICARCLVADQCLTYALENNEDFGVWGGTSERERRQMRRALRRTRAREDVAA